MDKKIDELISKIEESRKSKVIAFVTADGPPPFKAKIATDIIPIFYKHLDKIKKTEKIDLFIYSSGGDIMAPWRLINLLREYSPNIGVLIPYRALSAATMIALGANEIVMGPLGELSPIDPNIATPFNPPHYDIPNEPKIDISVEDVFGYLNLAKEKLGIKENSNIVNVLSKLVDRIHPLAIGAVYRTHSLIRLVATNLLSLHMTQEKDKKLIKKIIDDLIEKLFYHGYLISRSEAKKLGLKVKFASEDFEKLLWELYLAFCCELKLDTPFNPLQLIPEGQMSHKIEISIACICSRNLQTKFLKQIEIIKIAPPQGDAAPQIRIQDNSLGWKDFINGD